MTGDPIWLGGNWFAGIHSSTTISTTGSRRIRKSLEAAGFSVTGDPIQLGGKQFVGIHPRSWNKDAPVVNPSLSPQAALAAAVERNGKSLEAAGFHLPEPIQLGRNTFVVLRPNRIVFVPVHGGGTAAQKRPSKIQLLRTYESIERDLGIVQIAVGQNNGEVAAGELRESFRGSYLYKAAGTSDWENFADDFRPAQHRAPTPREVALRFLARTTGLGRGVVEKYCSQARNNRK